MLTSSCFPLEKVSGQVLDIRYYLSLGWLSQKWWHQSTITIWNSMNILWILWRNQNSPEVAVPRLCKAGHSQAGSLAALGQELRESQPGCQGITQARAEADSESRVHNQKQSMHHKAWLPDKCILLQHVALLHSLPTPQQFVAVPDPMPPGVPGTLPLI